MVTIRLTRNQLEQVIVWGALARDAAKNVGVPWERDEYDLHAKFRQARLQKKGGA